MNIMRLLFGSRRQDVGLTGEVGHECRACGGRGERHVPFNAPSETNIWGLVRTEDGWRGRCAICDGTGFVAD